MELNNFLSIKMGSLEIYRIILTFTMLIYYFIYHRLAKYKPSQIRILPHCMIVISIFSLVIVFILKQRGEYVYYIPVITLIIGVYLEYQAFQIYRAREIINTLNIYKLGKKQDCVIYSKDFSSEELNKVKETMEEVLNKLSNKSNEPYMENFYIWVKMVKVLPNKYKKIIKFVSVYTEEEEKKLDKLIKIYEEILLTKEGDINISGDQAKKIEVKIEI